MPTIFFVSDSQAEKGGQVYKVELKSFQNFISRKAELWCFSLLSEKNNIYIDYKTNYRDKIAKVITWAFVSVMLGNRFNLVSWLMTVLEIFKIMCLCVLTIGVGLVIRKIKARLEIETFSPILQPVGGFEGLKVN